MESAMLFELLDFSVSGPASDDPVEQQPVSESNMKTPEAYLSAKHME